MKYIFFSILPLLCLISQSQPITDPVLTNPRQVSLPYNRIIQPAGLQIYFGDKTLENHSLDASLSPDGKWLVVEERYSIVIIGTSDNEVKFILANNTHADLRGGMNTFSGIIWHKGEKGMEIYWSTTGKNNRSFVVSALWDGTK